MSDSEDIFRSFIENDRCGGILVEAMTSLCFGFNHGAIRHAINDKSIVQVGVELKNTLGIMNLT